jgi:folate-dependent phosphoribosylglycinamide formyltransferase PurN
MSGAGSNARVLISNNWRYKNINISAIVADREGTGAAAIAKAAAIPCYSVPTAVQSRGREAIFATISKFLGDQKIEMVLYCGLMLIAPPWFIHEYPALNVHPADLSVKDDKGRPAFVGLDCIRKSVASGDHHLACTVHVVEERVDEGQPILVTRGWEMPWNEEDYPSDFSNRHRQIKLLEHITYPFALVALSEGITNIHELPVRMTIGRTSDG